MQLGETVELALARELQEELGLGPNDHDGMLYVCSKAFNYPTSKEVEQLIVIFMTTLVKRMDLIASDDVASYEWRDVASISASEMFQGEAELTVILQAVVVLARK